MTLKKHPVFPLSNAVLAALSACAGNSSVTNTTAALTTAQCTYQANRATAEGCFATFQTCSSGEGADVAACRTALKACLPPPPAPMGHGEGCQNMDGGMRGEGHRHIGHEGLGGAAGGLVTVDAAAIAACHDALTTCLGANPADETCFGAARTCVHAAFDAAFTAACATTATTCAATDPECARLQHRCDEGVDGNPTSFDGGTCQ